MTAPTKTWKNFESEIASLFSDTSTRNPLSGRNNINDMGERRPGDVIIPELSKLGIECLVECKLYRSNAIVKRAEETRKEAENLGMDDWLHFERRNGNKKVYVLACSEDRMRQICHFLLEKMIDEKYGPKTKDTEATIE